MTNYDCANNQSLEDGLKKTKTKKHWNQMITCWKCVNEITQLRMREAGVLVDTPK